MRNMTGTHVSGDDFIGREHELNRCLQLARDGNDILMLSPRRVGKTSLSVELGRRLYSEEGWFYIRCDVQSAKNERQFLSLLRQDIEKAKTPLGKNKAKEFKKVLGKLQKIKLSLSGVEIDASGATEFDLWDVFAELDSILEDLAKLETKVLLVIDELPIFLKFLSKQENGLERVGNMLDWLNSIRETPHRDGLTWFLCGSIGLDSLTEQLGMPGKIQKFNLQKIGAMPRPEAEELLEKLNVAPDSYSHSEKGWINHSLEKIGWLTPNYIQLIFSALKDIPLEKRSADFPAVSDVDIAYKEMTGKNYTSKFSHWDSRLGDSFIDEDDTKIARDALDKLCLHPLGRESDTLCSEVGIQYPSFAEKLTDDRWGSIIRLLERDGYVELDGSKVIFLSPLLRDYWKNKKL